MKVLNSRLSKNFLIECLEIDLYDLLFKDATNQLATTLAIETYNLLEKYKNQNLINDFVFNLCKPGVIIVDVYIPNRYRVHCKVP